MVGFGREMVAIERDLVAIARDLATPLNKLAAFQYNWKKTFRINQKRKPPIRLLENEPIRKFSVSCSNSDQL